MNPTPTQGFAFPEDARNRIDQVLRDTVGERQLQSVRPERRNPIVTPQLSTESVPEPVKTVPVQTPAPSPVASEDAISVELPSRFHYYSFKDLYVKPMRVPHLAKIAKAHETGSLQTQAEAVSSLLFTSDPSVSNIAFQLCAADYQAVLYWLRMISFSKQQMRITTECTNEQHLSDVANGLKDKKSLDIQTIFHKSDLKFTFLDQAPDPEKYCVTVQNSDGTTETVRLRPERLIDTIAFLDHPNWLDEEFQFKSRLAAVLDLEGASGGRQWTWDQKIKFVDEALTPDQVILVQEFAEMVDAFGVIEVVETVCMECGSKGTAKVTCDPLSFLSPKF